MTMTDYKWSDEAWEAARPVYEAITRLPFVVELAAGTLPMEKFIFYLSQDAIYLKTYCRMLASIASRADDREITETFLTFADDCVAVENAMHADYLSRYGNSATEGPSPSCLLYTSILASQVSAHVEVQAASILPCFWVYYKVGMAIAASATKPNPYQAWIDTYSYPGFDESTRRAIEMCDRLAAKASPELRRRMAEVFVLATKMEWMFWESAYNLEKWKI